MKYFSLFVLAVYALLSCTNTPPANTGQATETPSDSGSPQNAPDLVAITDAIHHFYKWYESNMEAVSGIRYVKGGQPATLDKGQLDAYCALLVKSGFISQEYIDAERAFLKDLEATAWKSENADEGPLTGLDYDRFFCAQDWDIDFWTTASVSIEEGLGTDRVTVIMSGTEAGGPREQYFEMKKENGKWLIVKIVCE